MAQQGVPKESTELRSSRRVNLRELHKITMKGDKKAVINKCGEPPESLLHPLQPGNDSVLHVAIQTGHESLAREILEKYIGEASLVAKNDRGDTILHEAATTDMRSLVEYLLNSAPELAKGLVFVGNKWGENPLFKAVHYGQTEMFQFLADKVAGLYGKPPKEVLPHLKRSDGTTILHVAILAGLFDLALKIAETYLDLTEAEDGNQMTALQILSSIPSAFKSGRDYGMLEGFIYKCMPEKDIQGTDQRGKQCPSYNLCTRCLPIAVSKLCLERSVVKRIENEKHKHESALKLARVLIKNHLSRQEILSSEGTETIFAALVLATRNGIVEIVNEIFQMLPQAVEQESHEGQNILHVAIRHRQSKIFRLLQEKSIPMARLARSLEKDDYTILHHVGFMPSYEGGHTQPSPAMQLQEELLWFELVHEMIPHNYARRRCKLKEETALELFQRNHQELLEEAREWLKRTSVFCSVGAVLITAVAFAAAYAVCGGSNKKTEIPIFSHDPFFLVFLVMDVVALSFSLISLVMFLSVLRSPSELQDFRRSLPLKLKFGLIFLFISVAMTKLAFAATIVLNVHLKKQWTVTLVCFTAFLLVTIFALLQFHLPVYPTSILKPRPKAIRTIVSRFLPRCFDKTPKPSICKDP